MTKAPEAEGADFSTLPALSCGCHDDKASFSLLVEDDNVVLSPFSKPSAEYKGGDSCSHPCFADELEREILELENVPNLQKPRSAEQSTFSNLSSSFPSAPTGKPGSGLQAQDSFNASECGIFSEASNPVHTFSTTAECQPVRAGLRRKQPLPVALENIRRLRLHGVASRPGAWQGCCKSPECNREERHRGLCNRRATIPGVASYPEPEVHRTAIAMGMPVASLSLGLAAGLERCELESTEGSVQESDQSDQTQPGFSPSCNAADISEDEQDGHDPQSEGDEYEADVAELCHSDDEESGADGVSSGVSRSDCGSPSMGLSAFEGDLESPHAVDRRSEKSPPLLSSEYPADGLDVDVRPVPEEVFADDIQQGIVYGSQEFSLAWHWPPSSNFLPESLADSPEMSISSQAPMGGLASAQPLHLSEPCGGSTEIALPDTDLVQLPKTRSPPPPVRNPVMKPGSRRNKRPLEFNTKGPAYPGQQCTQCSTQSTPVWRAGPLGPKTLCNACGVRYMKVAKRTR